MSEEINKNISVQALSLKTKGLLSALLNPVKIIPTDKGLPRDWQGLAELCKIKGEFIANIQSHSDPCNKVLELWYEGDNTCTIDKLLKFLEELDRYDIIDDITELIDEDIKQFNQNPIKKPKPLNLEADKYILTRDDVNRINEGLEPQYYDAFVLFADDDIDFATELIETMEKQYKMKFCVKERDLVGGGFELDVIIKLITERCNRLIVILSQSFFNSPANKFFLNFAQSLGMEQRQRKVIPCIYKDCDQLPSNLSCYFLLDYRRAGKLWNFWDKLRDSINTPNPQEIDKFLLNRSHSENKQHIKSDNHNLRPINHSVKFNSMVNLNESNKILTDQSLSAGTSTNSLGNYLEFNTNKKKNKINWWYKIIHKNYNNGTKQIKSLPPSPTTTTTTTTTITTATQSNNVVVVVNNDKSKKKFWLRHNKKKTALTS